MTMLRPRYAPFQHKSPGCEERSDSIVDSFQRTSGDLHTAYHTERSESFDTCMMHSNSFSNSMPANPSERHSMEETNLMSVLEQVTDLSLESNCNERPRPMMQTPSQHRPPALPSEHHARLDLASGMSLQRPCIARKTRSNSFLVHNAPRIPESPDLADGQAATTGNYHHHRYLPPQFSPVHNQVLVQYPQHVREVLHHHQQQQQQRALDSSCREQDDENIMEEAFCDEQSSSCPPPPPMPTIGTPDQSCAADNRMSSAEPAGLLNGALKMRRVNARALVFS